MVNRMKIFVRESGIPGYPAGDFRLVLKGDVKDLAAAEKLAMDWIKAPPFGPCCIRVEVNVDDPELLEDITLEAETGRNGEVWWFIGPPPDRTVN